ncbi:MAG TPA: alpha/beta fold hydrolase [Thermoanaerobaculia bacterium]
MRGRRSSLRPGRVARSVLRAAAFASAAGAFFLAASWLAARRLADRLVSASGLGPTESTREELLAALALAAPVVEEFRHKGSARDPVELAATFASPGDPSSRSTIVFLHGKGGHSSEWRPDALRALALGYNVLVPDLRGHGASGGRYMTFGFLEKDDLGNAIDAACGLWNIDPARIGLHSCSAGSAVALELATHRPVRAIWLESPFANPREMARHYLAAASGIPAPFLSLTTRWAVARTLARVKRDLGLEGASGGLESADPLAAMARLRCPVSLVYGGEDRLIPPRFVERLIDALPPGSEVFHAEGAGHCHHANEAAAVAREEYLRRWTAFFGQHLRARA